MKFVSFNPWKNVILKSIVQDDDPMVEDYANLLKEHGDYFIGITEADESTPEHGFEELNIVAIDAFSFTDILNVVKKDIDNEELIEIFEALY